ncbi:hypothetical protein CBR56_07730 [Bacillus thuringiensis]|uniref:hypothetical protein n=1 Tax=Bacillus tropicus TaxID=2026188 RepID=UPI000B444CBF|nr:hypothetical protein [Bacillus tropicus]MED3037262.1 hypothetical protein [Bacillus tropicus]OTX85106.1 hypothetical protein BK728_10790 [Bacillus thuringiensis serovar chanpaisis]PNK31484.1 hypothetical protein CBR56_07730 [Bacillus thuringiensis]
MEKAKYFEITHRYTNKEGEERSTSMFYSHEKPVNPQVLAQYLFNSLHSTIDPLGGEALGTTVTIVSEFEARSGEIRERKEQRRKYFGGAN